MNDRLKETRSKIRANLQQTADELVDVVLTPTTIPPITTSQDISRQNETEPDVSPYWSFVPEGTIATWHVQLGKKIYLITSIEY